jgi:nucleotide-binding universal stress UspA family protein
MYKRILVGVDDSATANRALWEAIRLAWEQRAQLRLVHVITWPIVPPTGGAP